MKLEKLDVADNIRLSYINTDKFKTESLTLSLCIPLTPENYLMASLLCGVLNRGCERLPSIAHINRELDRLYASTLNVRCSNEGETIYVSLCADMLGNRFIPDGTDVLRGVLRTASQLLLRPLLSDGAFPQETVAKEIVTFTDMVRSIKNNTRAYASVRLGELMDRDRRDAVTLQYIFENAPKVSSRSLTDFYTDLLSSSSMTAFYVGDQDPHRVGEAIREAFAGFVGSSVFSFSAPKVAASLEFIYVTEDMPVTQGKLAMGFRTGTGIQSDGHAAATVFNEVFGATPASKLFVNVRERLSLCYYCRSRLSPFSGNLTVSSGVDNSNRERAAGEILAQLEQIRSGNVSDAEMEAAKRSLEFTYAQIYDSPYSLQSFYVSRETVSCEETVEQFKDKLCAVTREDICDLARRTVYDTQFFIRGTGICDGEECDQDE